MQYVAGPDPKSRCAKCGSTFREGQHVQVIRDESYVETRHVECPQAPPKGYGVIQGRST